MRKRKKGRAQTCQIFLMVCVRYGHLQVSNGARATETAAIKRDIFVTAAAGFFLVTSSYVMSADQDVTWVFTRSSDKDW